MATFLALLEALPQILKLFSLIMGMVHDAEQRGLGRKEAVAEALVTAHRDIAAADAVEVEATQAHARDKNDTAFDQDFREDR